MKYEKDVDAPMCATPRQRYLHLVNKAKKYTTACRIIKSRGIIKFSVSCPAFQVALQVLPLPYILLH